MLYATLPCGSVPRWICGTRVTSIHKTRRTRSLGSPAKKGKAIKQPETASKVDDAPKPFQKVNDATIALEACYDAVDVAAFKARMVVSHSIVGEDRTAILARYIEVEEQLKEQAE